MLTARYLANKRYRKKYPGRRAIERKKNYATTGGPEKNSNHREKWTIREMHILEAWLSSDRSLHLCIGRSVQAIQNMRHKLKEVPIG